MSASMEPAGNGRFRLLGVLDFESVPVVWRQHKQWLETAKAITIDLSGVEHSNSAGIALLLDWQRHAGDRSVALTYTAMPEQMKLLAGVSGVMKLLNLTEGDAAHTEPGKV